MILYLDIETIPLPPEDRVFFKPDYDSISFGNTKDPDKKQAKYEEAVAKWTEGGRCALDELQGQVALAGMAADDGEYSYVIGEERHIVGKMMDVLSRRGAIIVGHNVYFDLRFLVRRAMILGIEIPQHIIGEVGAYKSQYIFDTMKVWQLGDRSKFVSLSALCHTFGIDVKSIKSGDDYVSGDKFYKFWSIDKPACINYNKQDVLAVRELAKKMGCK